MSDNAEEGIARVQLAQKDGLAKHHKSSVNYIDDRILIYLFALAFLGLLVVWVTASSPIVIYGSLVAVALAAVLFVVLKFRRVNKIREQRDIQVKELQSKPGE